jgi:hypothetical protein
MPVSHLYCLCINDADRHSPIQTYGSRGVEKQTLTKNDHAIIYTGSSPPKPTKKERPATHDEAPMRPPVRVNGAKRGSKLATMSRVNYRKIYTVEHNVKVYEFGKVHDADMESLISNFNDVWQFGSGSGSRTPRAYQNNPEEEEDDNEDGEEEGEEEEGEDGTEGGDENEDE